MSMVDKKKTAAKKKPAKKAPASPQGLVREMMRLLEEKLGPNDLIMPDDVQALIASLQAPQASDRLSDAEADAQGQAQQLAFDAMEARTAAEARKLAKRALRLDPDCVDALVVMANLDARTSKEMILAMQNAVAAGERSLGETFIRENKGHFWLLIETRPYMRAMEELARLLSGEGLRMDAIRVYERMLELNPNDNQGVRDPLLGLYLSVDDLAGAGRLLKKFEDDAMANFAWGRVLERFLAGDQAGARAALEEARQANQYVELFMTARRRLPEGLPEMYSMGSEEEAVLCMIHVGGAWAAHKDAVMWLLDQLAADGVSAIPGKAALKRVPVKGKKLQ